MSRLHRVWLPIIVLTLMLAAPACTGNTRPEASSVTSGGGVISQDSSDTPFVPGSFIYRFNSITAQATFDDNNASLSIRNDTGAELGSPSIYVIGADDRRYDATSDAAAPIADGEQATLQLTFPDGVTQQTIGLVVLVFGDLNVGAMAPLPVSGP